MLFNPAEIKVLVVGGGTMGADVALVFARGGCATQVFEVSPQRRAVLPHYFEAQLNEMGFPQRLHLLSVVDSLHYLDWSEIDLVVECVPEKLDIKQDLFAQLEQVVKPETVLASNSSSFPISAIAKDLKSPARMIGLHFFMPAHIVPCVEVVYGERTSRLVAESLSRLMTECGMVPVTVKKDLPGFLANRLQHALSREAFDLIDAGIVTAEDVDKAVRFGFGFRYLAAGPVLQRDHAGVEIHAAAGASIYPSLNNKTEIAACLKEKIDSGSLGMKTGRGFYEWDAEKIKAERQRYDELLRAGLKLIRKELPEIK
jgi:3-hydroxybutyryl-CoA dehydrogenase